MELEEDDDDMTRLELPEQLPGRIAWFTQRRDWNLGFQGRRQGGIVGPVRRPAWIVLLLAACGDPAGGSGSTADTTGSSGAQTSLAVDTGSESSAAGTTTTSSTTDEPDPTVPPGDSTGGPAICSAPYAWGAATMKDVVVVVTTDAALAGVDLDALHAEAQSVASDEGLHVAVAAPPTGNEPAAGSGYEALALPAGDDPMDVAAAVQPSAEFRRVHAPLRVVVVTQTDTVWDPQMLRSAPETIRHAQIDARVLLPMASECDAITGLEALSLDTSGSLVCTTGLDAADVLDADGVLGAQPSCALSPAARPPPVDGTELTLALHGIAPLGPQSDFPGPPSTCRDSPSAWTLDARTGAIGLCPARCRKVASWYLGDRLGAEIGFDCAR